MEPSLDTIHKTLHGDEGARAFLERTSSIYLLDVTDPTIPKTYGCWNFIHQAMNEMERYESSLLVTLDSLAPEYDSSLIGHARLLATVALRAARRSPAADKRLITTCLANSEQFFGTPNQAQQLINFNYELREIVMGRIATLCFDFSFHQRDGPSGRSAFADSVVLDMFCAVLSANAVCCGPQAVRQFASEWIIPSSKGLPAFAVAAVILHLAKEGMRKTAPAGTKDMLQQLSLTLVSVVLVPLLSDAVTQNSVDHNQTVSLHEANSQVAAMSLRALNSWSGATELSLPQVQRICAEVDINIVSLLADVMYSDSMAVLDALAETFEVVVLNGIRNPITQDRMEQVRHILSVSVESFQVDFSPEQLMAIESREMELIIQELVSAVGLQRFRFMERQNSGNEDVCRLLACIASHVCSTWVLVCPNLSADRGLVDLLQAAAGHPSVNISSMALVSLTELSQKCHLDLQFLLPTLQRRAIIPRQFEDEVLSLSATNLCGVCYHEFENFRNTVLVEALVACCGNNRNHYLESCISAVEEFCSERVATDLALQLEAALFCIESAGSVLVNEDIESHIEGLTAALLTKAPNLMSNPLTLVQMCRTMKMFSRYFVLEAKMKMFVDLVMATISGAVSSSNEPDTGRFLVISRVAGVSPVTEALIALKEMIFLSPKHFSEASALKQLIDLWDMFNLSKQANELVTLDGQKALCACLVHVFFHLPQEDTLQLFDNLIIQSINWLEKAISTTKEAEGRQDFNMSCTEVANYLRILAALSRAFATEVTRLSEDKMDISNEGSFESVLPEQALISIHRPKYLVIIAAERWSYDEVVGSALGEYLVDLLFFCRGYQSSFGLLSDLFDITQAILHSNKEKRRLESILNFLIEFARHNGGELEKSTSTVSSSHVAEPRQEMFGRLKGIFLTSVCEARDSILSCIPAEQVEGQPALEYKTSSLNDSQVTNELLWEMFSLLKECMVSCPTFILHLPSTKDSTCDCDLFLTPMLKVTIACIDHNDADVGVQAIEFLTALLNCNILGDEKAFSAELSGMSSDIVGRLLKGCCGDFDCNRIQCAAKLLSSTLTRDPQQTLQPVLERSVVEKFKFGPSGIELTKQVLHRAALRQIDNIQLTAFLESIWSLHQVEDVESLPESDSVLKFIQRFG